MPRDGIVVYLSIQTDSNNEQGEIMAHGHAACRRTRSFIGKASLIGMLFATGGAYAADGAWVVTNTGCKVWSNDPANPEVTWTATWTGPCKNGIANGQGTEEWFRNGVFDQRLEGTLTNGVRTGTGTYTWASGNRYEGPFVDDARTGKGKFFWTNGDTYEGDFIAGKRTGKGVYVWADGKRYEGDMVDGQITGQGFQLEPNGNTYRGEWQNNTFHGTGIITFASDGSVRAGQFVNGKIFEGTDSKADGTLVATYSNGVRSRASTASDSSGVVSFVAGLLGAAAQGVASGGGRNAAQYQAVATALQAASGSPGGSPSGAAMPSAQPSSGYNAAASAGNAGGGTPSGLAGRKTIPPISGCVDQVRIPRGAKGYVGWYAVETGLTNKCGYTINVAWCVTGLTNKDGNDAARCENQYSGLFGISPGEQISMHVDRFGTLVTLVCKDPAMPLNIQWNGTRFSGQCYLPPGQS
ncbi:hypothetical protein A9762_03935 [Pandoraea sp. ISTKB]|nr:hypothetical protein A9762_03935 [Pandoraea sp. ISTKB]